MEVTGDYISKMGQKRVILQKNRQSPHVEVFGNCISRVCRNYHKIDVPLKYRFSVIVCPKFVKNMYKLSKSDDPLKYRFSVIILEKFAKTLKNPFFFEIPTRGGFRQLCFKNMYKLSIN